MPSDNRACKVMNPGGVVHDVGAAYVVSNKKRFTKGDWKILEAPEDVLKALGIQPIMTNVPMRVAAREAFEQALPTMAKAQSKSVGPVIKSRPVRERPVVVHAVPWKYHLSGMWIFVKEMAEWCATFSDSHIVCPDSQKFDAPDGVTVHYTREEANAVKIVESLDPDIVHHHGPQSGYAFGALDFSRVVGTDHGSFEKNIHPDDPWVVPIIGPNSIWHGVDLEVFHPPQRKRKNKVFKVGISGRVDNNKIPEGFLKELEALDAKGLQFVILGDVLHDNAKSVKKRLEALPFVRYMGWIDRANLPQELRKLDILCVPSNRECCPMTVIEGMACGLPVVARNTSGLTHLVGDGGFLCENDAEIIDAIRNLSGDKGLWQETRKRAAKRAIEHFDIESNHAEYMKIYGARSRGAIKPPPKKQKPARVSGKKPRVILAIDSKGWAFHNIALQLEKRLSDEFDFTIAEYHKLKNISGDLCVYFWWHAAEKKFGNFKNRMLCLYDTFSESEYKSWKDSPNFPRLAKDSHGIIAANDTIAALARARTTTPVHVCEDGVDLDMFPSLQLPDVFMVGWCGSSDVAGGNKGIDLIKEACACLGIPMHFHDRKDRLIEHADMSAQFYRHISCYCCASKEEGTPNPVLESLASGRPVISTDVGIVRKVINDANGIVANRTVADIQRALLAIQGNGAAQYSTGARKAAESFSWEVKAENWRKALRSVFE